MREHVSRSLGLLPAIALVIAAHQSPAQDPARGYQFTPVLHSVSYAGVWRGQAQLTLDQFLVKAKELGFSNVEVVAKRPHLAPLDYNAEGRKRLKTRLQELGIKIVCIAGYSDFTAGSEKPGIPSAEIHAIYVGELARLARELDAPYVRVFTGYERPGVPFDVQWGTVVQGLKMASRKAAEYGVTLVVQNHHDIAIHPDATYWLLKEVNEPNCKAAFDAWSPALQGINGKELADAVRKMAPFMAYTTVADYVKHPRYRYDLTLVNYIKQDDVVRAVPFGTGFIDYGAFFGAMKQIGYKGYVAYEMCEVLEGGGSVENLDRTARKFLEKFNELAK
ncbi:MAG: sugar phosphate isomerase/epimerase [Acidobacteria bacterium]|nr:sugar phosphate isomerase/epimerase [Acidobacteriota bacterium]